MTIEDLARALLRGAVAGAIGGFVQNRFFQVTRRIAPEPRRDAFDPPEPAQRHEPATQTVARRFVEEFMQRGPLDDAAKARAGTLVHYAFATGWGIEYAAGRLVAPALASAAGTLLFATAVWVIDDDFLLPAFRLSAWPARYPPRSHAYAWVAHVVYALAVRGAYDAMDRRLTSSPLAAAPTTRLGRLARELGRRFADSARSIVDEAARLLPTAA